MIDGPRYERYDEGLNRLFGGDIRAGVRAYFHQQNAMLERNRPTIVGHPDKIVMHNRDRYFHEDEPWYRDLALETIHLIHELDSSARSTPAASTKAATPTTTPRAASSRP